MKQTLLEYQNQSPIVSELCEDRDMSGNPQKSLFMKGIFIQGDVRNHNQRIYPSTEIRRAVEAISSRLQNGDVLGEADHPQGLNINIDRVSHKIVEMGMDGANGIGKLKLIPTPMGNIIRTLIEGGVRLGVSSRGSGNVNEASGFVSDFEIVTVDVVATPSAPQAYPQAIWESLMNSKGGNRAFTTATETKYDPKMQKYLKEALVGVIRDLKKL